MLAHMPAAAYNAPNNVGSASMSFAHRHLLGIEPLSQTDITTLLDLADTYADLNRQPYKHSDALRGLTQINMFFENSTRTQASFEIAGKRLGADVMNMAMQASSIKKGETLIDTAMTLNAMHPDLLVVRHPQSGAVDLLAQKVNCAVLNAGEAGQGFMNVASAAAGRLTGGAAKVSVLSSALFGSISGSASANVASTGAITLPAMTKLGYPKRLAAAVEAVASSGGQIMPPLMGAGAFVMVELTGVPYTQIMLAASLPAILYFLTVWMGINAYAQRFELQAVPEDQRPGPRVVAITSIFFLVPFSVLLFAMFIAGFTPQYAAVIAIFAGVAVLFFDATPRMGLRQGVARLGDALRAIGQQVAMIAAIIICASIIIGVLGITGLGIKITSVILSGSGGTLWPALLLTALACLLLGMEVPTTAAYVICVSVAGPALTQLGLEPLQAHLFVFWFALLSTITPPVCGAVFIAAGMIGENWLKVALTAMALGVGLYIIPLAMIANPDMIRIATHTTGALIAFVMVGIGLSCLSYALIGRAGWLRRTLLAAGGFIACFAGAFLP